MSTTPYTTFNQQPKYGMTAAEIAKELGMTTNAVCMTLARSMKKLKDVPHALEVLSAAMRARHLDGAKPYMACGSVECRADWIEKWGDHFQL